MTPGRDKCNLSLFSKLTLKHCLGSVNYWAAHRCRLRCVCFHDEHGDSGLLVCFCLISLFVLFSHSLLLCCSSPLRDETSLDVTWLHWIRFSLIWPKLCVWTGFCFVFVVVRDFCLAEALLIDGLPRSQGAKWKTKRKKSYVILNCGSERTLERAAKPSNVNIVFGRRVSNITEYADNLAL